ncbi:hypothetical protein [Xylophilus ampelinus]|uniref:hypothetical protein n=1 Tax=Xylophilus ampelinus TaxID=54067 RepID=UPI000D7CA6D4|nr:hypothetical protein [Xylophilus ampelinus]MCS4508900.1 hypothetical protein [Xylophilus ampelinus]
MVDQEPKEDADILALLIAAVRRDLPGISPELLQRIDADLRAAYGGRRHFLPKRRKHMDAQQRRSVYEAGLSAAPTDEIAARSGIHRATLYRLMKRPPPE